MLGSIWAIRIESKKELFRQRRLQLNVSEIESIFLNMSLSFLPCSRFVPPGLCKLVMSQTE